jgi:hypothetical protein
MERTIRVFDSFEEADAADAAYYASLTPAERLEILFALVELRHPNAASEGLARICRVVELEQS